MEGDQKKILEGFSKLSGDERLHLLHSLHFIDGSDLEFIKHYNHLHKNETGTLGDISENVLSGFSLPFSIAPNFLINNRFYALPMVIEESSVVAAASKSAKLWANLGGFHAKVISTEKIGQIHFSWKGEINHLIEKKPFFKDEVINRTNYLTHSMQIRGGGVSDIDFLKINNSENLCQLHVFFETADSMGANFINSCLEEIALFLPDLIQQQIPEYSAPEIVMAILSNYTPNCIVECTIECDVNDLSPFANGYSGENFAQKFKMAVDIANNDPYRAVTHNKGIFNGMDAVIIATGNDFRATEACGHAYAAKDGKYKSLSHLSLNKRQFSYTIKVPMSVGTVGGLTSVHPMAQIALRILGDPTATELMMIIASAGMANNFSAISSLITTGIQKGHMQMHLSNILRTLNASQEEVGIAKNHFRDKTVSVKAVQQFIYTLKDKND